MDPFLQPAHRRVHVVGHQLVLVRARKREIADQRVPHRHRLAHHRRRSDHQDGAGCVLELQRPALDRIARAVEGEVGHEARPPGCQRVDLLDVQPPVAKRSSQELSSQPLRRDRSEPGDVGVLVVEPAGEVERRLVDLEQTLPPHSPPLRRWCEALLPEPRQEHAQARLEADFVQAPRRGSKGAEESGDRLGEVVRDQGERPGSDVEVDQRPA